MLRFTLLILWLSGLQEGDFTNRVLEELPPKAKGVFAFVSPTGRSHIVVSGTRDEKRIKWKGKTLPQAFTYVHAPVWSTEEDTFLAMARMETETFREKKSMAIHGGKCGEPFDSISSLQMTPDGKHVAYHAREGHKSFVIHNDRKLGPFPSLLELALSPKGKLAWVTLGEKTIDLYEGGKKTGAYKGCSGLAWNSDGTRLAYVIKEADDRYSVHVNGKPGRRFRKVGPPIWDPTGIRTAYVVGKAAGQVVVYGGKESAPWAEICRSDHESPAQNERGLVWSPDGKRIAFIVREEGMQAMVIDGKRGPLFKSVRPAIFAPKGMRVLYAAQKGERHFVVENGKIGAVYIVLRKPVFSPDGKHVAFMGIDSEGSHLVVDGKTVIPKTLSMVPPAFSPDGRKVGIAVKEDNAFRWKVVDIE